MPAGSFEKMQWAFDFGADAVYAGVPLFSLRARENEFRLEQLQQGYEYARLNGKKIYLTANIFARNRKIKSFTAHLDDWAKLKPDAMIMSDPGLMAIVKEKYPEIPIHLSVQANCMNWRAVKVWHEMGVSRIILSRELNLNEIKEIRQRVPEIELEAFVHGAICIAYSGRCMLSQYMSYRDANQGVCDNSCRYPYRLYKEGEIQSDQFFLEDLRNPNEYYPIDEDEHGTYIMNAKDLCLIEHLKEIVDAGVCSLKVEGRTKSEYYVAMVTRVYRQAIDDMIAGRPFNRELLAELGKLSNRGYDTGFMINKPTHDAQNYKAPNRIPMSMFAAAIRTGSSEPVQIEVRQKIRLNEDVELISPRGSQTARVTKLLQKNQEKPEVNPGAGPALIQFDRPVGDSTLILRKPV